MWFDTAYVGFRHGLDGWTEFIGKLDLTLGAVTGTAAFTLPVPWRSLAWDYTFPIYMSVAYSQARPSQLGKPENITYADCSGSIAAGCNWAKVLPQVDWRYTNTDVQILFGLPVPNLAAALPGDVLFYGQGNDPSHEAMYLGGGRVWSFGSYPIKLLDADYRHDRIAIRRFVP